jgi:hypothetical protein
VTVAEGNQWIGLTAIKDLNKLRRKQAKLSPEKRRQEDMLFSLRYMLEKSLVAPPIPEVIAKAVEANDLTFFIRLGATLSGDPIRAEDYPVEKGETPFRDKLIRFLLTHWAEARDGLPELFYLYPKGLEVVCNHCLGVNHLKADALIKQRQRLGLKPFKRQKLKAVLVGGKLQFS